MRHAGDQPSGWGPGEDARSDEPAARDAHGGDGAEALARALAGVAHLPGFLAGIHQRLDRIERRVDELRRAFPPVLVTLHDAARALGVSYATVRRMKKAGRLPLVGAGRSARVDLTGLRPLSDEDADRVARRLASEPEGPLREKDDAT